jgi:acetolactate synthase-1/2/3 large subunit
MITEFGKTAFTRFTNPDFVKLAESFGALGHKVKSTREFQTILRKAKDSVSVPVIIAIDVDYSRNVILLEYGNSFRI